MKRSSILIGLIFIAVLLKGQGAEIVSAPILETFAAEEAEQRAEMRITTVKQLQEAVFQTEELRKSYQVLKEGYEMLEKINEFLADVSALEDAINRQAKLYKDIDKAIGEFSESKLFSLEEYQELNKRMMDFIKNGQKVIKMLSMVVTPGKAKMNDSERMQNMILLEDKINENCLVANETIYYYYRIRDERDMYQSLNKVQNKYK